MPTETNLNSLKVHKVPDFDTWTDNYNQNNGIGTSDIIVIPPKKLKDGILDELYKGSASGSIATFKHTTNGLPVDSLIVDINPLQIGSGDPTPTNVRAISGHSKIKVFTAGKNLIYFPTLNNLTVSGLTYGTNASHELMVSGTATSTSSTAYVGNWVNTYADMPFEFPAGTYKITCSGFVGQVSTDRVVINARYADGTPPSGVNTQGSRISSSTGTSPIGQVLTITATQTFRIGAPYIYVTSGTTIDCTVKLWMERVDEFDDYEPYQGTTKSISLGRTVYGGKLNVTTGELTVTWGRVDMGSLTNWGWNGTSSYFYASISGKAAGNFNLIADCYKTTTSISAAEMGDYEIKGNANGSTIYAKDSRYSGNAAALTSALSGHYLAYELATPETFTLTPVEVTTLLGENNIWATSGDVEVQFGEDIKNYVDRKNTSPIIGSNASFDRPVGGIPLTSLVTKIKPIQLGTGDPSTTNVREITGSSSIDVAVCGRNLIVDNKPYPEIHSSITTTRGEDGCYILNGEKANDAGILVFNLGQNIDSVVSAQYDYKKWLPTGRYKISINVENMPITEALIRMQVYKYYKKDSITASDLIYVGSASNKGDITYIDIKDEDTFVMIRLMATTGTATFTNTKVYPMIQKEDDTDISWYPPSSSQSISLNSTIYGGELDVTTGKLTVTHKLLLLDGVSSGHCFAGKSTTSGINEYYCSAYPDGFTYNMANGSPLMQDQLEAEDFCCSVAPVRDRDLINKYAATVALNSAGNFQPRIRFLNSDSIQDLAAANAWLTNLYSNGTPCTFCYKLKEEYYETYQLTPIEVKTLLGKNNIWTTAGDVSVDFNEDIKNYVDTLIPSQSGNSGKYLKTNGSTLSWDSPVSKIYTASCSTAAGTAAKIAVLDNSSDFSLTAGVMVVVRFQYGNTATTPTLRVDGTTTGTAKTIAIPSSATAYTTGNGTTYNTWGAYESILFTYTGTYWTHIPSGRLGYITYNLAINNSNSIDDILNDIYMTNGIIKSAGDGETISAAVAGTDYVAPSSLGAASGVATLDGDGKIIPDQLTSKIESVTASRNLATSDNCHTLLCSNSNVTLTIPNTITTSHFECEIIRWQSANTVTIAAGNNVKIAFSGGTTAYTSFKITDACESAILKRIMESSGNQYWLIQGKVEAIS